MRGTLPLVVLTAAVALCGLTGSTTSVLASTSPAAVVKVAFNKKLQKNILVDGRGRTLYLYTADRHGKPTCTAASCKALWPPLTSTGHPVAGKSIRAGLLGDVDRGGGYNQVTYNKHPLYLWRGSSGFVGDKRPGDVRGQGFSSAWYVVSPRGNAIHE